MKITQAFLNGKAILVSLTCGYPDLEITEQMIYALEGAGASLIELGIPFSDPAADAPPIQMASACVLRDGLTTDDVFDLVQRVRKRSSIPLTLKTYANVVFSYGIERFVKKAVKSGVNALVLSDVPYEEKQEFATVCGELGLVFLSLVAPAPEDRVEKIVNEARGYISLSMPPSANGFSQETVRKHTTLPVVFPLGATSICQIENIAAQFDGVLIDQKIMEIIIQHGKASTSFIHDYVQAVMDALKS